MRITHSGMVRRTSQCKAFHISMTDDLPICPYCEHVMIPHKRKNGYKWVNEGMDGPNHWIRRITYRYYYRCHYCNARGPLTTEQRTIRRSK